jgi:hypothetical protein
MNDEMMQELEPEEQLPSFTPTLSPNEEVHEFHFSTLLLPTNNT